MTAPTPAIPTMTGLVTAAKLNALATLMSGLYTRALGGFRTSRPICLVRTTTTRTVANNTDVLMTWDAEDRDTDSMFTPGGQTITVPIDGLYHCGFFATITATAPASTAMMHAKVVPNATTTANARASQSVRQYEYAQCGSSALIELTAGSVIRFYVRQTSGGSASTSTQYGGSRGWVYWAAPLGNS